MKTDTSNQPVSVFRITENRRLIMMSVEKRGAEIQNPVPRFIFAVKKRDFHARRRNT
ncbi:hypothetical protein B4099_3268 [Heyndrickxia coagulans]|uniref:Uncharacterized protein n=1 Tax=Heyndrickxia coagulans TaxID=1398 RepID=A0A150KID6_HEYCO|nr:hypothetical protein B4099_3268 [Heyndrickxia coagulans]